MIQTICLLCTSHSREHRLWMVSVRLSLESKANPPVNPRGFGAECWSLESSPSSRKRLCTHHRVTMENKFNTPSGVGAVSTEGRCRLISVAHRMIFVQRYREGNCVHDEPLRFYKSRTCCDLLVAQGVQNCIWLYIDAKPCLYRYAIILAVGLGVISIHIHGLRSMLCADSEYVSTVYDEKPVLHHSLRIWGMCAVTQNPGC